MWPNPFNMQLLRRKNVAQKFVLLYFFRNTAQRKQSPVRQNLVTLHLGKENRIFICKHLASLVLFSTADFIGSRVADLANFRIWLFFTLSPFLIT
jgi:hypothetical protein